MQNHQEWRGSAVEQVLTPMTLNSADDDGSEKVNDENQQVEADHAPSYVGKPWMISQHGLLLLRLLLHDLRELRLKRGLILIGT
jgi:hypothetical protein